MRLGRWDFRWDLGSAAAAAAAGGCARGSARSDTPWILGPAIDAACAALSLGSLHYWRITVGIHGALRPVSGLTAPERKVGILYVRLLGLNSTYCPVLTHLWCTFIYDTHLWHISMTHTYDKPLHGSVFSKRAIYLHDVVCSGALPSSLDGII